MILSAACPRATTLCSPAALAREYDYIYAAVGSHPDAADEVNDAVLDRYRKLCRENPKIKAVGEIGLDYYYEDIPRDIQKKAFVAQMELARELKKPVIVHEREAHQDGMDIVTAFPEVTGVFHCFSGSAEMAGCPGLVRGLYGCADLQKRPPCPGSRRSGAPGPGGH